MLVEFVIDENGEVTNPVVVESNNPGFNEPAIDAIIKWKFEPGRKNGKPVKARMQQPVNFYISDGLGQGAMTVKASSKKAQETLPPELRYDVAPQPTGILNPVYPYALARDNITGKAAVAFLVDAEGKVSLVSVYETSQPEFGLALVAAIEAFRFRPALKDGKPTATSLKMGFEFESEGTRTLSSNVNSEQLSTEKKHPQKRFCRRRHSTCH